MKDQTCIEIVGMVGLVVLGAVAVIYDGDIGESLMVAVSAGLGAFMTHVYYTGGVEDEKEVQK